MLIVMAGLPGSGKSTVAEELGRRLPAPVLSVDPVEAALWSAGVDRAQPTGLAAYVVVEAMAAGILALSQTVIVDAVNDAEEARAQWSGLAERQGVPLAWIEVVCSDPDLHRRRLQSRRRDLPGFPEPGWDSLAARRAGLGSWREERLVLDSAEALEPNVEKALAHLRTVRVRAIAQRITDEDSELPRRLAE
ncbi:AAA family ATPase [Nocardiopsis metallicus]|uniref:Putative kinase n=1 Tax=Nocardiopsis metallicus TaxID=179819 RepID=A0A840W787_9ACTN|nr:ATP-binding protein [Nocardiopsis metallicus]MBB5492860.1 putative kinase [Nocardiopsis metallicus]